MMQFGNILNLTQLNLMEPSLFGSGVQVKTSNSESPSDLDTKRANVKPVGVHVLDESHDSTGSSNELTVQTPLGNREIDYELVLLAQRGDKRAFGMLVDKYQRKLGRLISRLVRDQVEIEDIAQETFIKAYRALPSFRGDSAFYTWLYRIGINTAKNHLISMGRRPSISTDIVIEDAENFGDGDELRTAETPESSMMTKQIAQTVNDAVSGLPEDLRTAITLREIEGLSYEDIATVMACPIGTVRSRIFRAREAISAKLKPLLDAPSHRRW